jgi:hypothetical protein
MTDLYIPAILEDSEKLYNNLIDQLVCEVVNENVSNQSINTLSSLPALPQERNDSHQTEESSSPSK